MSITKGDQQTWLQWFQRQDLETTTFLWHVALGTSTIEGERACLVLFSWVFLRHSFFRIKRQQNRATEPRSMQLRTTPYLLDMITFEAPGPPRGFTHSGVSLALLETQWECQQGFLPGRRTQME